MKKLLIALLILGFAAPALGAGANFDLYGSFRTHLGYYSVDEEYGGGPGVDNTVGIDVDDDSGTVLSFGGNSTFGANIYVTEDVVGKVELGLREAGDGGQTEEVYLRQALGSWNFGGGKLLAGKTYTPATFLGYSKMGGNIGSQYDGVMLAAGLPYIGRQPQLRLTFGGFEFALIEHNSNVPDFADITGDTMDTDFTLPRMEAAYTFKMDPVTLRGIAGYQSYDVEQYDAAGDKAGDESIDSHLLGLGAKFDFKPFYVNTTVSYQQNPGNYGNANVANVTCRSATIGWDDDDFEPSGSIEDATVLQGTLVAGYRLSPMVNFEAGFSYQKGELDESITYVDDFSMYLGQKDLEQTAYVYYAQAWISLSENFHIIPEIGVVDRKELEYKWQDNVVDMLEFYGVDDVAGTQDADLGKMSYFDVSFRYEF